MRRQEWLWRVSPLVSLLSSQSFQDFLPQITLVVQRTLYSVTPEISPPMSQLISLLLQYYLLGIVLPTQFQKTSTVTVVGLFSSLPQSSLQCQNHFPQNRHWLLHSPKVVIVQNQSFRTIQPSQMTIIQNCLFQDPSNSPGANCPSKPFQAITPSLSKQGTATFTSQIMCQQQIYPWNVK